MTAYLLEWATLFTRWLHFAAGIAWIGASFYFIWVENVLERQSAQRSPAIAGHLWAVHGGGFYYLEKYKTTPDTMPPTLHWFKWEAYTTWLTGMAMVTLIYYVNAQAWLLLPGSSLTSWHGIALSLGTLAGALVVYLILCSTPLLRHPHALAIAGLAIALVWVYELRGVFAPRAAYLHLGAALGTIMVANVLMVIIPGQRRLVASLGSTTKPDPALVRRGVLRSTHNNYLALPVLLLMLSGHFPVIYTHTWWAAILVALMSGSVLVRHALNLHANAKPYRVWGSCGGLILLAAMLMSGPWDRIAQEFGSKPAVAFADVRTVIMQHCVGCHAAQPTDALFKVAPLGFVLDNDTLIVTNADAIYQRAVVDRSMPFNNQTGITEQERNLLHEWYLSLSDTDI